jgi:adenylate kinase family enzyme
VIASRVHGRGHVTGTKGVKKIVLIGISGTGKSRRGRELAERTGLPIDQMDWMVWTPHWTLAALDEISAELARMA